MLTKTSLSAIRALMYIAMSGQDLLTLRQIAEAVNESPSYLAKVLGSLGRAGVLRVTRGAKGGVHLARRPARITLLSVVEACQGVVPGSYCEARYCPDISCAYHEAALELQQAIIKVLSRWSLDDLIARPAPLRSLPGGDRCLTLGTGPMESRSRRSRVAAR